MRSVSITDWKSITPGAVALPCELRGSARRLGRTRQGLAAFAVAGEGHQRVLHLLQSGEHRLLVSHLRLFPDRVLRLHLALQASGVEDRRGDATEQRVEGAGAVAGRALNQRLEADGSGER